MLPTAGRLRPRFRSEGRMPSPNVARSTASDAVARSARRPQVQSCPAAGAQGSNGLVAVDGEVQQDIPTDQIRSAAEIAEGHEVFTVGDLVRFRGDVRTVRKVRGSKYDMSKSLY